MKGFPSYLKQQGWAVHVVSSGDSGHAPEYYLGPSPDVRWHRLPMRRDPSPAADIRSLLAWWRLIRRVRPDVVLLGTPKASLLGLTAAALARVPVRIYLLRGLRFEASAGLRRRFLSLFEATTAVMASHVLAVSPSLRDVAIREGVASKSRISVLGAGSSNGVELPSADVVHDVRRHRRQRLLELGLDPDLPTICYVGRLTRDKGVLDLATASSRLAPECPHQLLWVGAEDAPGCLAQLTSLLEAAGVPYAMTGYVEAPAVYMALADVFCLPSHREGMPNVSLEAQSLQIPVVTTDATGCRDSVLEGRTGLTVPVGNSGALASALEELIGDPVRRDAMGAAGAAWVSADFERETVWARYEHWIRCRMR